MNEQEALFLLGLSLKYLPEIAGAISDVWSGETFPSDTAAKLEGILPEASKSAALVKRLQAVT